MKKLLTYAICLVAISWACQKEDEKVTPDVQKATTLTAEEQLVADRMGGTIPFDEFTRMTEAYKKTVSEDETRAVSYGKTVLEKILSQKGCVGIRFYFAKDTEGRTTMVFIGVDKNGHDVKTPFNAKTTDDPGAGGKGPLCPSDC